MSKNKIAWVIILAAAVVWVIYQPQDEEVAVNNEVLEEQTEAAPSKIETIPQKAATPTVQLPSSNMDIQEKPLERSGPGENPSEIKVPEWPEGSVEFEIQEGKYAVGFGDIILGVVPEEKRHLKRAYFDPPASKLWPSAQIAYSINDDTPNKKEILSAIEYFNTETPVRFIPRTDEEESIIFVAAEKTCASQLGRVGGHQVILISPRCGKTEVIHELMHSLGFVHEHSREDRDKYLEVVWNNIEPEYYMQFQMVPDSWIHEYRGSVFNFDPNSIMLYPSTAFAKSPGLETLKTKGAALEPKRDGLSSMDKERVYYLYGH